MGIIRGVNFVNFDLQSGRFFFQNQRVHTQTLHILPHFFTNLQEKVGVLLNVFYISCLRFLELGVFDDICEYVA